MASRASKERSTELEDIRLCYSRGDPTRACRPRFIPRRSTATHQCIRYELRLVLRPPQQGFSPGDGTVVVTRNRDFRSWPRADPQFALFRVPAHASFFADS